MSSYRFEQTFLKLTTSHDRDVIKKSIAFFITLYVTIRAFISRLVMRWLLSKNLVITTGALLTLFLIYLIIRFFRS